MWVGNVFAFVFVFVLPPHQSVEIDEATIQEEILAECSHNVNLLFHLLDNVTCDNVHLLDNVAKGESFAKQKKCRDIRCEAFHLLYFFIYVSSSARLFIS